MENKTNQELVGELEEARKRISELEASAQFRSIFENAVMGLFRTTPDGEILMANPALLKMMGYLHFEELSQRNLKEEDEFDPKHRRATFEQLIESEGQVIGLESIWFKKDGSSLFVRENAKAIRDAKGKTLYYEGTVEDITERVQAEKALQESEERFRKLSNLTFEGILIHNKGVVIDVNESLTRMFGFGREELIGKNIIETLVPREYHAMIQENIAKDNAPPYELMAKKKDGVLIPVEVESRNVKGENESYRVTAIRDITEQIQTQKELRLSEEKFRGLVEASTDWIWETDIDGVCTYCSPHVESVLGYKPEEIVGKLPSDLKHMMPSGEAERLREIYDPLIAATLPIIAEENLNLHKNGQYVILETSAVPYFDEAGKYLGYRGVDRDITKQRENERERETLLRNLEHRSMLLETAANISKSLLSILSPDELLQKTVELIRERFNYYYVGIFLVDDEKEFALLKAGTGEAGKKMLAAGHKLKIDNESMIGWCIKHTKARIALDVGKESIRFVNPFLPETRSEMALPMIIQGDAIGGLIVQSSEENAFTEEDITVLQTMVDQLAIATQNARLYEQAQSEIDERAQAEKALQESEERLRKAENYLSNIINSMPSTLIGIDTDGKITQWNSEAERVSGLPPSEALGQPLEEAFPRLTTELERVHVALKTRKVQIDPQRAYQQNDETHYEDVTIYPLVANGIEGAVIRVDDVTEKVQIEELMLQSEKMLSVGGLAAGMAHEINNPLAGMMQTADVMNNRLTSLEMPANQRAAEAAGTSMKVISTFMEARGIPRMLKAINTSGLRVAEIVDNMLSFARRGTSAKTTIDLASLLDRTLELATTDYDLKKQYDFKTIETIREYEELLPYVLCESSKIQQVFLNILRNGAQAMHDTQKKENREPSRFTLRIAHEKNEDMVRIEIEDNGAGMDEATCKRIFEPFFTTKPVGEGTGLGLSVSYFIISENHGGTLDVISEPNQGANFIIRLPVEKSGS